MRHWLRELRAHGPGVVVAPLRQVDPLPDWVRASTYRRQNGGGELTAPQRRRIRHKLNRARKRGAA